MPRAVVIAGASLAGLRAAQALRNAGHEGPLVVVGDEQHLPYTRPPLSKELLAGAQEPAAVRAAERPTSDVEWRLGAAATGARPERARADHRGGERLGYDRLIVATGARPRHWPGDPIGLDGVHTLRSVDDALALRAAFEARPRLVVVGAGFIGCEVAATARKRGLDVTLIDVAPQPVPALGADVGARCRRPAPRARRRPAARRRASTAFEGAGRLEAVRLADGTRVEADVAVIALGAIPNTDWLVESGLELQPGRRLRRDARRARRRATSSPPATPPPGRTRWPTAA